ncbi:MAG: hypothetical protein ACOYBT_09790 [Polynucleobacter sp.]
MNALTVIEPANNVDAYRASTDAASLCREIVVASAKNIQGRNYVCVEGWQAIAVAHGCAASARGVERVEGGIRAIGEVRRMSDGVVIAEAEGFVGEDEETWFGGKNRWGKEQPKRADYAIRAMAQTRAISRACRSAFAHVVVMMNAGLSTTPAEEVPMGGFEEAPITAAPRHDPAPSPPAEPLITDSQRHTLISFSQAAGLTSAELNTKCRVSDLRQLPVSKFEAVKKWLEDKIGGPPPADEPARQLAPASDILDDHIPF